MRYQTISPALEAKHHPSVRHQMKRASSGLRLLVAVLYETMAAHQRYERLKRRGLDDAAAVRLAFFGPSIPDEARAAMRTPCRASVQAPLTVGGHREAMWGMQTAGGSAEPTLDVSR
jgi:hypothetical protein